MISVVVCSVAPDKYSAACGNLHQLLGTHPHEFVGVHDAGSISEAYNRGIRRARGDKLILCHDDIEILSPDFRELLLNRLNRYDLLGVAGSDRMVGASWFNAGPPHIFGQVAHYVEDQNYYDVYNWGAPAPCIGNIRVMDGLFLAGHRRVFQSILFDQETFRGYHLYDMDFTLRASQAGFKLAVCTDLAIIHHSVGKFGKEWEQDAMLFAKKHFDAVESGPIHEWQAMRIKVTSKSHLMNVMRNPYWSDAAQRMAS